MILLTHILIALTSLAFSSLLWLSPSRSKLRASYGLIAATLLSGTYLVASTGGHLLEACIAGLFYLAISLVASLGARRRLATAASRQ